MDNDLLYQLSEQISQIEFIAPSTGVIISSILVIFLLIASGFASGSEIAFFSLSPKDLSELDTENNRNDKYIKELRDNSERTLATILILNNLVNVTIIMLCNYIFASIINFHDAIWMQFICITILLTFLLLLFGEVIPKVYSRQKSLEFCRAASTIIIILRKIFWPLETVLLSSSILTEKVFHKENHILSVDELEQALEMTDKEDIKEEKSILQSIIRFSDETVREIMTNRKDMVNLDINSSYNEVLKCIIENNYSRIPIYQNNTDNIRGVLYIKDLLPHLSKPSSFHWQSLIRPPYFVPEMKKIDDLLNDFKRNKVHIAIVVDEFGGTSGLITMEDILEEIVGEINDEFDEDDNKYTKINYNTYIFDGKTELAELSRTLKLEDDYFDNVSGDADTIAGLLLELKADFPSPHEHFEYKNVLFEVMELNERRISKVKITVSETK